MTGLDLADRLVRAAFDTVADSVTDTSPAMAAVADKLDAGLTAALLEAARSAAGPGERAIADAMLDGGTEADAVTGGTGTAASVAAAHAFLMHAHLRDDAYRTAAHPGQLVVPVALAVGQALGATGRRVREAALVGYEVAGHLADLLLPAVADRGWRVSAVLAGPTAAVTAAYLHDPRAEVVAAALRLAACHTGGGLHVVRTGADWRMQPALGLPAGVLAARLVARGGHRPVPGALDGPCGLLDQFGGTDRELADRDLTGGPRIGGVTFKRYDAPTYAQGVLDACHRVGRALAVSPAVTGLRVHVCGFSDTYAGAGALPGSVGNVAGVVLAHAPRLPGPLRGLTADRLTVVPDEALAHTAGRALARLADGSTVTATGDGDTTGWGLADLVRSYRDEPVAAAAVDPVADAVSGLAAAPDVAHLVRTWRDSVTEWTGAGR